MAPERLSGPGSMHTPSDFKCRTTSAIESLALRQKADPPTVGLQTR